MKNDLTCSLPRVTYVWYSSSFREKEREICVTLLITHICVLYVYKINIYDILHKTEAWAIAGIFPTWLWRTC